eukprot:618418-Prorocentrum_minimum.AAC.1
MGPQGGREGVARGLVGWLAMLHPGGRLLANLGGGDPSDEEGMEKTQSAFMALAAACDLEVGTRPIPIAVKGKEYSYRTSFPHAPRPRPPPIGCTQILPCCMYVHAQFASCTRKEAEQLRLTSPILLVYSW